VNRDCVRVTQLDTTNVSPTFSPTLRQDFLIAENGKDSYMGGIGMAGNGTLHVVWSRSSATAGDFPSSYAAYQLASEAVNSISPKELLKVGTGVYTGERWGDYVGVAQDPIVPSAVWQGNEYSGTGSEWKTWISRLRESSDPLAPGPGPGQRCKFTSRPDMAGHWRSGSRRRGRGDRHVTVTQQRPWLLGCSGLPPTTRCLDDQHAAQ
jgi:hypothetical protein